MKILAGDTIFGEEGGPRPATPEDLAEFDATIAAAEAEVDKELEEVDRLADEIDQTDLGASDDRSLGADHPAYRKGTE